MTQHSFLPPSGAAAWSKCAMWPTMNARYPQDDTAESLEGTAAHWVLSEILGEVTPIEGTLAPNGIMVTGEMLDGAELAKDTVRQRIPWKPGVTYNVEKTVTIHTIHKDCFGTPDVWSYTVGNSHLEIVDYKFGHGFVDEYFNPQGLLYMLGIVEHLTHVTKQCIEPMNVTVSFTIVQPRCFYRGKPVRTHNYVVKEAGEHVKQLAAAAKLAYAPKPVATTNPECDYCPGRHACDALQRAAYSDAETSSDRQPHDLTPRAAGLELRMLERALSRLEARVEGLRELTLANIRAGKSVPQYRVEPGKGRPQWNIPTEQIITIGQLLGKDLSKPGVITPTQAKKIIDESVISHYSSITPGPLKLIPESNADAARVFGVGDESNGSRYT
jgi:hypothetical protein